MKYAIKTVATSKTYMAARKRKVELSDKWKDGIKVSMLMGRLYGHALGENSMEATQIKAAQLVLSKLVPDLARQEIHGPDEGAVQVQIKWQSSEN